MKLWSFSTLAVAAAAVAAAGPLDPNAAGTGDAFTVRTTLAGKTVLPHRIPWLASPSLPASQIQQVRFTIDGKLRWVEGRPPYTYGNDGNYLVTTWLSPGIHTFVVLAIAKNRQRATVTTHARVVAAPQPPAPLAGTWTRVLSKAEVAGAIDSPPGQWQLTIDKVGWHFHDPGHHGALVDVAYLGTATLEARSGFYTGPPGPGLEGNLWCDTPFQPVRYHWTVSANTLTLALAGPKRCDGQSQVWAGQWTRS
jgi:hypothetical protein